MAVRRRYFLHLCPTCGDQYPYAGSCDSCGTRLTTHAAIPVETITEFQEIAAQNSSAVPQVMHEWFVENLLEFSKSRPG